MRNLRTTNKVLCIFICILLSFWAVPTQVFADESAESAQEGATASQSDGNSGTAMRAGSSSLLSVSPQSHAVAKYNGEFYETLQEALNAATSGGEVSLIAHTEEGELKFPADGITLNLGGHTLTIPEGKKGNAC